MAKRKSSSGFSSRRKRVIWILVITLIVVVVIAYETGKEMRRQADSERAENPQAAPAVQVEQAQAAVRSYYRSHEFPPSWTVGKTNLREPDGLEVSIYFSPRIGSPRHGQEAPPGDITTDNACPMDDNTVIALLESFSLTILVNDKTGIIDRISC